MIIAKQRIARRAAALAACVVLFVLASGCAPPVNLKKLERQARMEQNRMVLPRELTRPRHLEPFSGEFRSAQDAPGPGFSISIPPGGWFRNTGLSVPGAAAVFVHGDVDPFDVVVAVAPSQPKLSWDAPPAELRALAVEFFSNWHGRDLQPVAGSEFFIPDADPPRAGFTGYFGIQGAASSGSPPHDKARIFAFPAPDGGTTLLVFTYPEIFEQRLEMHIADIASSFRNR